MSDANQREDVDVSGGEATDASRVEEVLQGGEDDDGMTLEMAVEKHQREFLRLNQEIKKSEKHMAALQKQMDEISDLQVEEGRKAFEKQQRQFAGSGFSFVWLAGILVMLANWTQLWNMLEVVLGIEHLRTGNGGGAGAGQQQPQKMATPGGSGP